MHTSIRLKHYADTIDVSLNHTYSGEPLLTFVNTANAGKDDEKYVVTQLTGDQVKQLKAWFDLLDVEA